MAALWQDGAQLRFVRQGDGSFALQTPNGLNYLRAIQGGRLASGDNLATDRTQVQAWEKFQVTDDGHCMYTISNG
jgi:hypothetical protein